jgi:serine/threonine protein kinase
MKPANLLLGDARDLDSVKICDLGLAKKASEVRV